MNIETFAENVTRVWISGKPLRHSMYYSHVGAFRAMFYPDYSVVILKSLVPTTGDGFSVLKDVPTFATIEIHAGKCLRPDTYHEETLWLQFVDCNQRRSWVPNVTALSSRDKGALYCYSEFVTDTWEVHYPQDIDFA